MFQSRADPGLVVLVVEKRHISIFDGPPLDVSSRKFARSVTFCFEICSNRPRNSALVVTPDFLKLKCLWVPGNFATIVTRKTNVFWMRKKLVFRCHPPMQPSA